jgi:methionine synthase II (cobalamin-independent)
MEDEEKKLAISIVPIEDEEFKFQGEKIVVRPYLSITTKIEIMRNYIDTLFEEETVYDLDKRFIYAEYALMMQVIDSVTNLDVTYLNPDDIINSKLWDQIRDKISRYDEFRKELDKVVKLRQEQVAIDRSIGYVMDKTFAKITYLLEKLPEIDSDTLKASSVELIGKLDELNAIVPGLLEENKPIKPVKGKRGRKKKEVAEVKEEIKEE